MVTHSEYLAQRSTAWAPGRRNITSRYTAQETPIEKRQSQGPDSRQGKTMFLLYGSFSNI